MTTVRTVLRAFLVEAVAGGALAGGRAFYAMAPQKAAYPRVTFIEVSAPRGRHQGGPDGLVESGYQIDVYAKSSDRLSDVVEAIRVYLDHKQGIFDGVTIQRVIFESSVPSLLDPLAAAGVGTLRELMAFTIWWRERCPAALEGKLGE